MLKSPKNTIYFYTYTFSKQTQDFTLIVCTLFFLHMKFGEREFIDQLSNFEIH